MRGCTYGASLFDLALGHIYDYYMPEQTYKLELHFSMAGLWWV